MQTSKKKTSQLVITSTQMHHKMSMPYNYFFSCNWQQVLILKVNQSLIYTCHAIHYFSNWGYWNLILWFRNFAESVFIKRENLAENNFHWLAHFCSFNHYSMTVPVYIITKVKNLEAFNFHRFSSSAKIAKINRRWNFLVLQ